MRRDPNLIPLSRQHHHGLALDVLVRRALDSFGEAAVAAESARCVAHFDAALLPHFRLEEELLFPAIENELGAQPLVARLIAEHRHMEQLAGNLRQAPSLADLNEFCATLRNHIRTEENELFEDIQQRLAPATLARLGPIFAERAVEVCIL